MQSSRDSSVWRTLAVAFGDGLAFGVGVHLTQSAARRAIAKPGPSEFHPRVTAIQPRIELPGSSSAVLSLIDGRFREVGGQIDRRLAELEVKFQIALSDLHSELDARDRSLSTGAESRIESLRAEVAALLAEQRQNSGAEMRALRGQMVTVHKEFAETLSRLVDDQISKTIADRLQPVEERLRQTVREEVRTAAETAAAQQSFDAKIQALHEELTAKDRQIADLRDLLEEHDRTVLDLVVSLGQSCLQAAERISVPVNSRLENSSGADAIATEMTPAAPPEAPTGPAPTGDLPGFAQQRPAKPLWRLPIVSSFLFATCGLLLLHYI